ncbi:hypothetical protein OF83DRAFT_1089506 [Amylostereum chailletii]|nr:hypothetical protein OF83DRAFT_1089506 [Amylostereum chailletii]
MLNPPSWNRSINRSLSHSISRPSTLCDAPSLGPKKMPSLSIADTLSSSSAKSTPGKSTASTVAFTSDTGITVTVGRQSSASMLALLPSPHHGGLLLDTTITSKSSPRATTLDLPLGFTCGATPGEYYTLTLVTAQWYFNDEEGLPYIKQTNLNVTSQEHDRIYNPQTPKREEVATAPKEEGSPPPPP